MSKSTSNLSKQMMSINPDALVELYEIDFSNLQSNMEFLNDLENSNYGSEARYRFCPMINGTNPIYWNSEAYQPLPIESEGFEKTGDGRLPRPKLRIANPDGLLSIIVKTNKDFSNCKVTRKRTYAKFLDQQNYLKRNTNLDGLTSFGIPDANSYFDDDVFYINRKTIQDASVIEFELVSSLELESAELPARIIMSEYCSWTYRCSVGCGYKGLPLETSDGKSLIAGFGLNKSSNLGYIDPSLEFNDIKEWSRYGKNGTRDNLKGYDMGDIIKIQGKETSNPYKNAPNVFVCAQSHEIAKNHYPFFDKQHWLKDECSKTVESCSLRFSSSNLLVPYNKASKSKGLRFGGFPGTSKFPVEG